MPRNDSILYTGQSSASRREEKTLARRREILATKAAITPDANKFIEMIEKEQGEVIKSLLSLVGPSTPEEDVKSLVVSLNLYKQSMSSLKTKTQNILRHRQKEDEVDDDTL